MFIPMKRPDLIWAVNMKKADDVEIDDMFTYVLPDEPDGLPMFPMGDLNAPVIFPSALNAMLYVMDFFQVTCEQAARSVKPAEGTFDPEPFDYVAIPMPSLMTCPHCGAAITEKNPLDRTAACKACGRTVPL